MDLQTPDYLNPAADAPPPTETAVVVHVPAADPAVAEHRQHLDWAASRGVPAHVTVLFPFVPPAEVDADLVARLAAAIATVDAFNCTFFTTSWFGPDVLWLAPDPSEPFKQLTAAAWDAFPEWPPYSGEYDEVVPHLTIGELRLGSAGALQHAERSVRSRLPVSTRVTEALLIAGSQAPKSWRVLHALPLAGATRGGPPDPR